MNIVVVMGRLTKDPKIAYSKNEEGTCVARYTLAVDKPGRRVEGKKPNFFPCVAFGTQAEYAEKNLKKGSKICVTGRLNTDEFVDSTGVNRVINEIIVLNQEFAESRRQAEEDAPEAIGEEIASEN